MIKIKPEELENKSIFNNIERIKNGAIEIILKHSDKGPDKVKSILNGYLYNWVLGIDVPLVLTDAAADYEDGFYSIEILIDDRNLICLNEPNGTNKKLAYTYFINQSELRNYKLNQIVNEDT